MDKEKIINGIKTYAEHIVGNNPQLDSHGSLKYYFSGSFAMLLCNCAVSISFINASGNGKLERIKEEKPIAENILSSLHKGVRQINKDLDIVEVQSNTFHYSSLLINNKGKTAKKVSVISPFLEQLAKKRLTELIFNA